MKLRNAKCEMRNEDPDAQPNPAAQTGEEMDLTRRQMIKLTAGAMIAPTVFQAGPQAVKPEPASPRFFTPAEFTMLDELSELIIPTDDHSPGARAAKVAEYIDQQLAEMSEEAPKQQWREGLALIDQISNELSGRAFMQSSPEQRVGVLERIARNEANPQKPEEKFFVQLKSRVAHAYYTSKIGIKDELEYKGNSYLREFAGEDVSHQ